MTLVQVGFLDEVKKILVEVRPYMALVQVSFPYEVENVLVEMGARMALVLWHKYIPSEVGNVLC